MFFFHSKISPIQLTNQTVNLPSSIIHKRKLKSEPKERLVYQKKVTKCEAGENFDIAHLLKIACYIGMASFSN